MFKNLRIAGLALATVLAMAPVASTRPPVVYYGPVWYGPGWYGPGWWGWYGPSWYGPYPYAYVPSAPIGKVKIETKAKNSDVYVDGGYAGTVKELGAFKLRTGTHDIELRHPGGESFFKQQVSVIRGRTTDIKIPQNEK